MQAMSGVSDGLIFDKDGTLFDFHATWARWTADLITHLVASHGVAADRLSAVLGFDPDSLQFQNDSLVIAHTPDEIVQALLPLLPSVDHAELCAEINVMAQSVPVVEVVALLPLFAQFRADGYRIGLATNDAEAVAMAHLQETGILGLFDFIAGSDSGFGGKPAPGMLNAFVRATGLDPARVAMVGDSLHDLSAGRAAGMRTVAVLTGIAPAQVLAPLADVVLPDISHLPDWLAAQRSR